MDAPLKQIRVLDLSRLLPGPFATMLLSDLGASVDKVEDPKGGDYLRSMPPHVGGMSSTFQMLNRDKRSLVLDLKKESGREALLRLLPSYDVVVETFRPGVMEKMGLGYERLKEVHPGLVYCAITGYGQDGPLAQRAGHDINYLARAGVLGLTGPADSVPQIPGVQVADIGGGALYAVISILAALHGRRDTGEGAFLDISMCEGSLSFGIFGLSLAMGGMLAGKGQDTLMGGIAPYGTYATKDGRAITIAPLEPKFFMTFCSALGLNPEMQALMPGPHQAEWRRRLSEKILERTLDEWVAFGAEHDCCVEPVLDVEELAADPQHQARKVFYDFQTGSGETMKMFRTPLGRTESRGPAPTQGQHSDDILREAGFSDEDIQALKA